MEWLLPLALIAALIFIHELGHFLAAKWVGVKVLEFSIGFPPRLVSKEIGGTKYSLGLLFFGGFVRLKGQNIDDEDAKDPENYASKSIGQRFIILIGGVFLNAVLAILLLSLVFFLGDKKPIFTQLPAFIEGVTAGSLAEKIGLKKGDQIVQVNSTPIKAWQDLQPALQTTETNSLVVLRDGAKEKFEFLTSDLLKNRSLGFEPWSPPLVGDVLASYPAAMAGLRAGDLVEKIDGQKIGSFVELSRAISSKPDQVVHLEVFRPAKPLSHQEMVDLSRGTSTEQAPLAGERLNLELKPSFESGQGKIGITQAFILEKNGLGESFLLASKRLGALTVEMFRFLGKLFTGNANKDEVGGPVSVFRLIADSSSQGLVTILFITAMISFQLAFFNILPIPALDGGHILLLGYELVARKMPAPQMRMKIQVFGTFFLLGLLVFLTWLDIARL